MQLNLSQFGTIPLKTPQKIFPHDFMHENWSLFFSLFKPPSSYSTKVTVIETFPNFLGKIGEMSPKKRQSAEERLERRAVASRRRWAAMSEEKKDKARLKQKLYLREKREGMSEEEKTEARQKMNNYLREKRQRLRAEGSHHFTKGPGPAPRPRPRESRSKKSKEEEGKKRAYMVITGKEYFHLLKDYIQKRVEGQNTIPPLLLSKAKYTHKHSLRAKLRERLVTAAEKELRHQMFVLCPELTVPGKERPKYAALSSLPLPLEEEYRLRWTRCLLFTLNRDYAQKAVELAAEAVEIEVGDKVPSKTREISDPVAENASQENSQLSTQDSPNSAQNEPNFDLSAIKIEPEEELDEMDMSFLADFDDRAEINEWMAQTAATDDDNSKPKPKSSRSEYTYTLSNKANQVAMLSSKIEELALIWDEVYPNSGPAARAALESELKALEAKIRTEKDEIVSRIWSELRELRLKLSEESEGARAERLHAHYEYSLQATWKCWGKKPEEVGEMGENTQNRNSMAGMSEEEKKAYNSRQQVIRQRMERFEYQMFKQLQDALKSPSISEQVLKLCLIFSHPQFQESVSYFYKRTVLKAKSPHVKVYRSKLFALLNKIKVSGSLEEEDVRALGEFMTTCSSGVEAHLEFKANYIKNKYLEKKAEGGVEMSESLRLKINARIRKYYHKKKYGVVIEPGAYVKGPYAPYGSLKTKRGRPKKKPESESESEETNINKIQDRAAPNSSRNQLRRSSRSTRSKIAENEDFHWPAVFPTEEETNSNSNSNSVYTPQNEADCIPHLMPQLPFNLNSDVSSFYNLTNAGGGFQGQFPSASGNYYEPQMPLIQQPNNFQQWNQLPQNIANQGLSSQHFQNFVNQNYSLSVQNLSQTQTLSQEISISDPEFSNNWSEEQNASSDSDKVQKPRKTIPKRRGPLPTTISNAALSSGIVENPFEAIKEKIGPELEALAKCSHKPPASEKPSFQALATGEDKPAPPVPGEPDRKKFIRVPKAQIRQARDSSPEKLVCKVCGAEIEDYTGFVRHLVNVHYESKDNYACAFCPKSNSGRRYTRKGIRDHIKARHRNHYNNSWIMEISWRAKVAGATRFICRHCPQLDFSSFSALHAHAKESHGGERYICPHCGLCLRADDHWKDHLQLFHPQENVSEAACLVLEPDSLFVCQRCHSEFSSQHFLSQHISGGHALSPDLPSVSADRHLDVEKCVRCATIYQAANKDKHCIENCELHCFWCKLRLRSQTRLKEHVEKFHPNEPPVPDVLPEEDYIADPYKCEICKISYPLLSTLRIHGMKAHFLHEFMQEQKAKAMPNSEPERSLLVSCPEPSCSSSLPPSEVHLNHVRYSNLMKRYCVPCAKLIIGPGALLRHNSSVHGYKVAPPPEEEPDADISVSSPIVRCPQCPQSFPPSIYHATHTLFNDEAVWALEGRRPPKSGQPLKKPESRPNLTEENMAQLIIITKMGERELFTCKVCLKNYKTEGFLRGHISEAHQEDAFSRVFCSLCNTTYANSKALAKHNREQHRKERTKVICPFCQLDISKINVLRLHVARIHPNESLNVADVKRVSISELNEVKGRQSCSLCNCACATPLGLKKHMERKHFPLNCHRFCDVCGLQMGNGKNVLSYHMQMYHPEKEPIFLDESKAGSKRRSMLLRRCLNLSQIIELLYEVYSTLPQQSENRKKQLLNPKTAKRNVSKKSAESEFESEEQSQSSEDESKAARKPQKRMQPKQTKPNGRGKVTIARKHNISQESESETESEYESEEEQSSDSEPAARKRIQPKRAKGAELNIKSEIDEDSYNSSNSESESEYVGKRPRLSQTDSAQIEKKREMGIVAPHCDSFVAQEMPKSEDSVINPNLSEICGIVVKEEREEIYPKLEFDEIPENEEELEEDPLAF